MIRELENRKRHTAESEDGGTVNLWVAAWNRDLKVNESLVSASEWHVDYWTSLSSSPSLLR